MPVSELEKKAENIMSKNRNNSSVEMGVSLKVLVL